jgi:hypothetical protein
MTGKMTRVRVSRLLASSLASGLLAATTLAQTAPNPKAPGVTAASPGAKTLAPRTAVPRSQRAEWYYARRLGVDHMQVRSIASGASLEFRYRVLDVQKAKILNEKRATPYLIDWQTGAKLSVPTMEKIGALRQVADPVLGREYWMIFSNPGKIVKPGERVDVVVGTFRVEGLMVE